MFTILQRLQGSKYKFDQESLDYVRETYAEESWTEFEEVLVVKYSDQDVEGIKKTLTGIDLPFSVADFNNKLDGKVDYFEEVAELKRKHKAPIILKDLYDIGVIGNYGNNSRFVFKGDDDIDPLMPLTIHYPLIRFFKASITSIANKRDKRFKQVEPS